MIKYGVRNAQIFHSPFTLAHFTRLLTNNYQLNVSCTFKMAVFKKFTELNTEFKLQPNTWATKEEKKTEMRTKQNANRKCHKIASFVRQPFWSNVNITLFDTSEKVKRGESIIKLCGVYHSVVCSAYVTTSAVKCLHVHKSQLSQWEKRHNGHKQLWLDNFWRARPRIGAKRRKAIHRIQLLIEMNSIPFNTWYRWQCGCVNDSTRLK